MLASGFQKNEYNQNPTGKKHVKKRLIREKVKMVSLYLCAKQSKKNKTPSKKQKKNAFLLSGL